MMASYPPEYLAENIGDRLFATCIAFLVIDTIFIVLLHTSRYLGRDQQWNLSMALLMSLGYLTCVLKITNAICKSPNGLIYS